MEQTQNRDCQALYSKLQKLDYYRKLIAERQTVADQYTQGCGPMTIMDNKNPALWEWGQSSWPWQNDV